MTNGDANSSVIQSNESEQNDTEMPPPPPVRPSAEEEPLAGPFKRVLGSGSPNRPPPTEPRNSSFRPFTMNLPKTTKVAKAPLVPKALDAHVQSVKFATGSNSAPIGTQEPSLSARLNRARPANDTDNRPPRSAPREPRRHREASPRRPPSPPPPPAPPKPTIVDKEMQIYHKVSMVGEGTYGKVYKASNNLTKELVALKRIRMESERDGVCIRLLILAHKLTSHSSPLLQSVK